MMVMVERTCRVCTKPYESYWARKTICPDCDIRASAVRLTFAQEFSVALLATENAFSRDRAFFGPGVKPVVMGLLRKANLVESRVVSEHRSQRTHYWLTPLGREVSRRK